MKRASVVVVLVSLLVVGCASTSTKSPVETAKLSYADASLAYEAAMMTIQDARANHHVTDAQWNQVVNAQKEVQKYAPVVRSALDLWAATGTQPASYNDAVASFAAAIAQITSVAKSVNTPEVKP